MFAYPPPPVRSRTAVLRLRCLHALTEVRPRKRIGNPQPREKRVKLLVGFVVAEIVTSTSRVGSRGQLVAKRLQQVNRMLRLLDRRMLLVTVGTEMHRN